MTLRNTKTPEQRKKIAEAYRQGVDVLEIRNRFGVGWVTLYSCLKEHGVPARKGRPGHP